MKKKVWLWKSEDLKLPDDIYKFLQDNFQTVGENITPDLIIVCGGDGKMLDVVKKYHHLNIPFVGLNFGHKGFLMNDPNLDVLHEIHKGLFQNAEIKLLGAKLFDHKNEPLPVKFAFNDFYFERATLNTAKIKITINKKEFFEPIICDGIIVCTPAGSTAYNTSAGGKILLIGNDGFIITGICPAIFHSWRSQILKPKDVIELEPVEVNKRPVRFLMDGEEIPYVDKAIIGLSKKTVRIIFANSQPHKQKIVDLLINRVNNGDVN